MADNEPPLAAAAALKYIEDQLTEERATKAALEARANTVITSAGTLTTLLFALAALVTQAQGYELPGAGKVLLVVAVFLFLVAITFALRAAAPSTYAEVTVESLRAIATPGAFAAPAAEAQPIIAGAMVDVIAAARAGNARKATDLTHAVQAELAAAVVVAAAVTVVLVA